jgi:hypothetical protein
LERCLGDMADIMFIKYKKFPNWEVVIIFFYPPLQATLGAIGELINQNSD